MPSHYANPNSEPSLARKHGVSVTSMRKWFKEENLTKEDIAGAKPAF